MRQDAQNEGLQTASLTIELRYKNIYLILLFLLAAVCLFANLWIGDLGLDSAAYATVSRAILRSNDWVVLHYEHCKEYIDFWQHPPLFFWMTALSFKIFGVTEFGARFVSALLGVFTILLVYLIGYRISNSYKIGFLSGLVLLTTQPFLDTSRKCQLDVPFAFFITLSILLFVIAIQKNGKYYIFLGISTGLALLTKGLPAVSIIGIVFLFFILKKDFKFFISARPFIFLSFIGLTLCIWLIPLIYAGEFKNFLNSYFIGQVWDKFIGAGSANGINLLGKIYGFFWYIITLARLYWPWLPFLVLSFYFGFKQLRSKKILLIFILWILIMLFGFSLAETKYYRYLAPLYPAFAIFIGVVLGAKVSRKLFKRIVYFSIILLLILLFATSIFPLYFGKISAPDKTELKKITPYIKSLTGDKEHISVYRMSYWGTVADFAFYVDRPINKYDTEDTFALSLAEGSHYGYIRKEEYNSLSEEFKRNYLPVVETESFYLITNVQNFRILIKRIFPFSIY
jgi:4-amino-4-deoxy-L-arabinose transferase-like glycosyltransferase